MTAPRAYRWCVLATLRDVRQSRVRRRTISLPNAVRLFRRRWSEIVRLCDPIPLDGMCARYENQGMRIVGAACRARGTRATSPDGLHS